MTKKYDSARRNFLINPKFQITFLGYMFLIATLNIFLLFAANKYFFSTYYQEALDAGLNTNHMFFAFLHRQQAFMLWVTLGVSVLSTLLVVVGGLIISHKVAGPMYRLTGHMKRVAEGETESGVTFRDKDFFPEVAEAYNAQLQTLLRKRT